jgi:hypothetical protein
MTEWSSNPKRTVPFSPLFNFYVNEEKLIETHRRQSFDVEANEILVMPTSRHKRYRRLIVVGFHKMGNNLIIKFDALYHIFFPLAFENSLEKQNTYPCLTELFYGSQVFIKPVQGFTHEVGAGDQMSRFINNALLIFKCGAEEGKHGFF